MSSKAFTAKVFRWLHQVNADAKLPASAAKVAIRLTPDFNEERGGMAWSAFKTMANDIGLSERHVIRAIRALEARGHLRVQWGKQGRGHSSQYWMLDREPDLFDDLKPAPAPVFEQEKTGISGTVKPASEVRKPANLTRKPAPAPETLSKTHRRSIEGKKESPDFRSARRKKGTRDERDLPGETETKPQAPRKNRGDDATDAGEAFERFWAVYPRHDNRERARKAFARATADTDPEAIIAAAQRYAIAQRARIEREGKPEYTAHAANWLRDRRWNDPLPDGAVLDQEGNVVAVEQPQAEQRRLTPLEMCLALSDADVGWKQ
jgi:Helix-turn-helix domain